MSSVCSEAVPMGMHNADQFLEGDLLGHYQFRRITNGEYLPSQRIIYRVKEVLAEDGSVCGIYITKKTTLGNGEPDVFECVVVS